MCNGWLVYGTKQRQRKPAPSARQNERHSFSCGTSGRQRSTRAARGSLYLLCLASKVSKAKGSGGTGDKPLGAASKNLHIFCLFFMIRYVTATVQRCCCIIPSSSSSSSLSVRDWNLPTLRSRTAYRYISIHTKCLPAALEAFRRPFRSCCAIPKLPVRKVVHRRCSLSLSL